MSDIEKHFLPVINRSEKFPHNERHEKIIALSGGFAPLHEGHIAMIEAASHYGRVHIYLNTDEWLMRKKGFVTIPFKTRAAVLSAIKGVDMVIPAIDDDNTVCENLRKFKPDYFGNGGDRKATNTPEVSMCDELGIKLIFNLGGDKENSSTDIIQNIVDGYADSKKGLIEQW